MAELELIQLEMQTENNLVEKLNENYDAHGAMKKAPKIQLKSEFSFKEKAVFGEENLWRVREIVESRGRTDLLAKIPPAFIAVDLTWRCNYNCRQCIEKQSVMDEKKRNSQLPLELIEDIMDYSKRHGVRGVMTVGGEVFLYEEGMRLALRKSIEHRLPLKTITNGSLLGGFIGEISEAYSIPGSILRVSLNAGKERYQDQTRSETSFEEVVENILEIASRGTPVDVSTVVFPEEVEKYGGIPNTSALREIAEASLKSGVRTHILLGSRNPDTKAKYEYTSKEEKILRELKEDFPHLETGDLIKPQQRTVRQKIPKSINYDPCPSGFLFTLVGSDGKIYKCTDNRGRDEMVLGEIHHRGDFEKFWHSEERVFRQMETPCGNEGCVRYAVNVEIDQACKTYQNYGVRLDRFFEIGGENEKIFT